LKVALNTITLNLKLLTDMLWHCHWVTIFTLIKTIDKIIIYRYIFVDGVIMNVLCRCLHHYNILLVPCLLMFSRIYINPWCSVSLSTSLQYIVDPVIIIVLYHCLHHYGWLIGQDIYMFLHMTGNSFKDEWKVTWYVHNGILFNVNASSKIKEIKIKQRSNFN